MRLQEFAVTNFRSIINTERFALGDFTVLIGPNNEGKSNLLRALELGLAYLKGWARLPSNYGKSTVPHEILTHDWLAHWDEPAPRVPRYEYSRDFPIDHKNYGDETGQTTIRLTFTLTEAESLTFKEVTGSQNNGTLPIRLTLTKSSVKLEILKPGRGNSVLAAKSVQIVQRVTSALDFKYVPTVRSSEIVMQLVTDLTQRQLRTLALEEDYASLTAQLGELRDKALAQVDRSLTSSLRTFLPELQSIRLQTQDTRDLLRVRSIHLNDGVETSLQQKGDGIQSLAAISLMQEAASATSEAEAFMLAVEEPESHLHPDAIHQVRRRLEDIAEKQQVVISTHSPLLVNRSDFSSNIIVEGNKARACKSLEELRDCLGVQPTDNLMTARLAILVEGLTDETALTSILSERSEKLASALKYRQIVFIATKGAGKIANRLTALRPLITPVFVAFDKDQAGEQAIKSSIQLGLLNKSDYLVFSSKGLRESELEDFYDTSITIAAARKVTGLTLGAKDLNPRNCKWSRRVERALDQYGIVFDQDTIDEIKIEAARLVAASPTTSLKLEWSEIVTTMVSRLESKLND
ncbi:ATP-dependent endonuclease [Arthrobacter sp. KBS0702]|uniref:ATP-dependent nuclease n=1 Tax=Arthrobacter sp. KBS0702 TaxID=2578107 RepID=UPI001643C816|nr:AAA family ATPase [Arthrobacter sp. KBS0702]